MQTLDRMLSAIVAKNTQELDDAGVDYEIITCDDGVQFLTTTEDGKSSTWPIFSLAEEKKFRPGSFRPQHPSERVLLSKEAYAVVAGHYSAGNLSLAQIERIFAFARVLDSGPLSMGDILPLLDDMLGFTSNVSTQKRSTFVDSVVH